MQCCKFHPNGNYLATGSTDRSVRLWDITTGQCCRLYTGHKVCVSVCVCECVCVCICVCEIEMLTE